MAIPGNDGEILSGAGVFFRKHVLKHASNSVYSGKPESRLGTPLELGIVEDDLLGTWDMPELLPVSGS